jgi:hypothetical protein
MINIILGLREEACAEVHEGQGVDGLIRAVNGALHGCGMFFYDLVPPNAITHAARRFASHEPFSPGLRITA